ncbi:autotransporter domain-containing protein [Bosea sp. 2RAB26]|uniref:autotransporter outer membrane beta-barrel domain-containing protein n=1 Tax=Bosea sp. 2RAB26 TaxID=3237476 RepID=UPI003F902BA7
MLAAMAPQAQAQTWNGTGSDFNASANWTPSTVPGFGNVAIFDGTTPNNDLSTSLNTSLSGITYNSGGSPYTIMLGDNLQLYGNVTNNSSATQAISVGGNAIYFYDANSGQNVNYNVSSGGEIQFRGSSVGGLSRFNVGGGSQVGIFETANAVALGSLSGSGLIRNFAPGAATLIIGGLNESTTFSGDISSGGAGGLLGITKVGSGTLSLTGTSTYSGTTTISGGVLEAASSAALGNGSATNTLIFDGGILRVSAGGTFFSPPTRNVSVNASGGMIDSNGATIAIDGQITGAGALTKAGTGSLTLRGANTLTGSIVVSNGTLVIANSSALGTTAAGTTVANGATLQLSGNLSIGSEALSLAGAGAGALVSFGNNSYGGPITLTSVSSIISRSGLLTLSDTIGGGYALMLGGDGDGISTNAIATTALVKLGFGTWTLSGVNTYGGGTSIGDGVLRIQNDLALGATAGGAFVTSGAALELQGTIVVGNALSLAGTGVSGTGALRSVSGLNRYSGAITLTSASRINADADQFEISGGIAGTNQNLIFGGAGIVNVTGAIATGTGSVTKDGAGETSLSGANTYTGATTVNNGILHVLGGQAIADSGAVVVTAPGTFQVNGSETIGSLSGAGKVVLNSGVVTLTIGGANTTTTYSGLMSGAGGLAKTGTGRLDLTGANTYTGATTINGGELRVTGSIDSSLGGVAVNNGGTLSGTGTIAGAVTVNAGGTLAAGQSPGTLRVGALTLNSGAISNFELNMPNVAGGTTNDRVIVTGNLTLGGTLNIQGAPSAGYYRLFDYGGAVAGSFGTVNATGFTSSDVLTNVPGQVNLALRNAGQQMQFWDGGDTTGATAGASGGSGSWNNATTGWTGDPAAGVVNDQWRGSVAVFQGAAGTVFVGSAAQAPSFDTIQFNTAGYLLTGGELSIGVAGANAGNAALTGSIINVNGVSATIDSVIQDGAGTRLNIVGGGVLTLTGLNTYSGGTMLGGGTLSVSADANLGAASGELTFAGGTLATTASFDTTRSLALTSTGRIDVASGTTLGLHGAITGAGDLLKQGAGTLTLTGANSYGNTLVQAGTLVGTTATIRGAIGNAGTVVFDQVSDAGFAGTIGGLAGTSGVMVKRGTAALTLTGSSSLDWTVVAGRLISASSRFAGNVTITAGAGFEFAQATDGVFAGTFAGAGVFAKTGTGTVTLTADSSGFAGATTVTGGNLIVGKGGSGKLGGALTIAAGGLLGGTGTISSPGATVTIAAGAVHAPGNSIGTQVIAGNYANHGTLRIEATPATADKLVVAGAVDITGATLDLQLSPPVIDGWNPRNGPLTIIDKQSAGAVTGRFVSITNPLLFLDPTLDYAGGDGNEVTLLLARNDVAFAQVALTRNQTATSRAVDRLPNTGALWKAIALSTDPDQTRRGYDLLSGEIHASAKTVLVEESRILRDAANERMRAAFETAGASRLPVMAYTPDGLSRLVSASADGPVFWGNGFGSWGRIDGTTNTAGIGSSTGGLLIGGDTRFGDRRLGLLGGYSRTRFDAKGRLSSGESDNYHLGLYAGRQWGSLSFRTGAAYSWHDIDTARSVTFPGFSDRLTSGYRAGTAQVFGELGYGLRSGQVALEPFANLAFVSLRNDGFRELGGEAALSGLGKVTAVTFSTLGLRAQMDFTIGGMQASAKGMIGWRHAFGDTAPLASLAFAGSNVFSVTGAPIAANSALVEAGIDLALSDAIRIGASYTGQLAADAQDHSFKANLAMRF